MDPNRTDLAQEKTTQGSNRGTLPRLGELEGKIIGQYVHFFEDDEFLIEEISDFIGKDLKDGEGVLVFATPAHRDALRERLLSLGINLPELERRGQFISLDACETMARFMVDGSPDEGLFMETVGSLVRETLKAGYGFQVFGEMVALLLDDGNVDGAVRMVDLWNRIGNEHFLTIFCSYPIKSLRDVPQMDSFFRICNKHARMIPGGGFHAKTREDCLRTVSKLRRHSFFLEAELAARKRAQMELQSTRDRLTEYLESASIGLKWIDSRGIIQWANKADYEPLGYAMEEYFGRHVGDFHADRKEAHDILARLGRGERIRNFEARMAAKDGSLRTVLIDCSADGRVGSPHHAHFFTRDITDHLRGENIGHRLAAIVECSDDAIIGEDLDGRITGWNKGAEEIFGYAEAEMLGRPFTLLIPSDRLDEDYFILERIRQGERIHHYETVRLRKDGTPIEISQTVAPIRNREGRIIGASKTIRDISERRINREALETTSEQLRHCQKMDSIGSLAGGIAHDFNNILTVINGYSDMAIMSGRSDVSLTECLSEIKKAGLRAASLTQQLLSYSRKQIIDRKVLLLNRAVEEMDRMLSRIIGENIELRLRLEPDLGLIRANADQINQIILNLVINARDAMPMGGRLTLSTANAFLDDAYVAANPEAHSGPNVMLSIQDTGTGMSEEVKRRIFEPFFTTKEAGKGTGLGLSSVIGIVKQSGASITVESEPGKGSEFRVYFPAVEPTEEFQ